MPRTPPLMMPTNGSPTMNWFANNEKGRESPSAYQKLDDFSNLSPFTYSPSEDGDYMNTNKNAEDNRRAPKKSYQQNGDASDESLFHKPTSSSKQNSQRTQYNDDQSNQNYELEDEDDSQNGENRHFDHNSNAETQADDAKFNSAVEGNCR